MSEDRLTRKEALETLGKLSEHFGEPVMPISRYCDGLRTWQHALHERALRLRNKLWPELDYARRDEFTEEQWSQAWTEYAEEMKVDPTVRWARCRHDAEQSRRAAEISDLQDYVERAETVDHVFLQIQKSSLLARLLYAGERLRTEMCPIHKGKWDGQAMLRGCAEGCDGEGWLPHKDPAKAKIGYCDHHGKWINPCPCSNDCYCKEPRQLCHGR